MASPELSGSLTGAESAAMMSSTSPIPIVPMLAIEHAMSHHFSPSVKVLASSPAQPPAAPGTASPSPSAGGSAELRRSASPIGAGYASPTPSGVPGPKLRFVKGLTRPPPHGMPGDGSGSVPGPADGSVTQMPSLLSLGSAGSASALSVPPELVPTGGEAPHAALPMAGPEPPEENVRAGRGLLSSDDYDARPILTAIRKRHRDVLADLLDDEGVLVAATDNKDETLLMKAVSYGSTHIDVIRLLIDRGSSVNAADYRDRTCLMRAASRGDTSVVKLLVSRGADTFPHDTRGHRALDWARRCKNARDRQHTVAALHDAMQAVVDAEKAEADERKRLATVEVPLVTNDGLVRMVRDLLDDSRSFPSIAAAIAANMDHTRDKFDLHKQLFTPLPHSPFARPEHAHDPAFYADVATIGGGWTPLARAASLGDFKTVQNLLDIGARVDDWTTRGSTALHWAASTGNRECAIILVRAGADYNVPSRNVDARTPFVAAVHNGHVEFVRWMLAFITEASHKAKFDALVAADGARTEIEALHLRDKDYSKFMRATLDAKDAYGMNAMAWAREYGFDAIEIQLEHAYERLENREAELKRERVNSKIIRCPMACGKTARADDMRRHVKELCKRRPILCTDCEQMIKEVVFLEEHQMKYCKNRWASCPNLHKGCKARMRAIDADHHLKHECPKRTVHCRLDCGTNVHYDDREQHEQERCLLRMKDCDSGCGAWIAYADEKEHLRKHCLHRVVSCTLECGETMMEKDRVHHEETVCINIPQPCPLGCGRTISPPSQLRLHAKAFCPERIVKCENNCGVPGLKAKYQEEHETERCGNRMATCRIGCGREFLKKEQENHEIEGEWGNCEMRLVHCRFDQVGKRIFVREQEGERRWVGTIDHFNPDTEEHSIVMENGYTMVKQLRDFDWLEVEGAHYVCGSMTAKTRAEHEKSECAYRFVDCENGCGQKYQPYFKAGHDSACLMRPAVCSLGCKLEVPWMELAPHEENECIFRSDSCRCGKSVRRGTLDVHKRTECPVEDAFCPNLCGKQVVRQNLEEHLSLFCLKRQVDCERGCGTKIFMDEVEQHDEKCAYRIVECPSGCGVSVALEELPNHRHILCSRRPMACKHGCGEIVKKGQMQSHEATCPQRPLLCSLGCGQYVKTQLQRAHEDYFCSQRFQSCRLGCGVAVRQNDEDIAKHELNCKKRVAKCPYGCPDTLRWEDVPTHTKVCMWQTVLCGAGSKECRRQMRSWVLGDFWHGDGHLAVCKHGETVLTWFALQNDVVSAENVLKLTSKRGIEIETKRGQTALTIACRNGAWSMAKLLLESGADSNYETQRGLTPLIEASSNGHLRVVELLVDYQAVITRRNKHGQTAIDWARHNNQHTMVAYLEDTAKIVRSMFNLYVAISCNDTATIKQICKGGVNRPHHMRLLADLKKRLADAEESVESLTRECCSLLSQVVFREPVRRAKQEDLRRRREHLESMSANAQQLEDDRREIVLEVDKTLTEVRKTIKALKPYHVEDVIHTRRPKRWMSVLMHGVCRVMERKPSLIKDPRNPYNMVEDWWTGAVEMFEEGGALLRIMYVDKEGVSQDVYDELDHTIMPELEKLIAKGRGGDGMSDVATDADAASVATGVTGTSAAAGAASVATGLSTPRKVTLVPAVAFTSKTKASLARFRATQQTKHPSKAVAEAAGAAAAAAIARGEEPPESPGATGTPTPADKSQTAVADDAASVMTSATVGTEATTDTLTRGMTSTEKDLEAYPLLAALLQWLRALVFYVKQQRKAKPMREKAMKLRSDFTRETNAFAPYRVVEERVIREVDELCQHYVNQFIKRTRMVKRVARLSHELWVARLLAMRTMTGHTAVSWAAANGCVEALRQTLLYGGCPTVADDVLEAAARVIQTIFRIRQFRARRGVWTTANSSRFRREDFANATWLGNVVHRLVQLRQTSRVPLHEALFNGHVEAANVLIRNGAGIGVRTYTMPDGPPPFAPAMYVKAIEPSLGLLGLREPELEVKEVQQVKALKTAVEDDDDDDLHPSRPHTASRSRGSMSARTRASQISGKRGAGGDLTLAVSRRDIRTAVGGDRPKVPPLALAKVGEQRPATAAGLGGGSLPPALGGGSDSGLGGGQGSGRPKVEEEEEVPPLMTQMLQLPKRGPYGVAIDWNDFRPDEHRYRKLRNSKFSVSLEHAYTPMQTAIVSVLHRQHRTFIYKRGWLPFGKQELALQRGVEIAIMAKEAEERAWDGKKQNLVRLARVEEEADFKKQLDVAIGLLQYDVVQELLNKGAAADYVTKMGHTALSLAAATSVYTIDMNGDKVLAVQALLDRREGRPVLDREIPLGHTAMSIAAHNGHNEVIEVLLDRGADVNLSVKGGMTPLIYAAMNGKPDTVRMLYERGAELERKDEEGRTAFQHALDNHWIDVASQIAQLRQFGSSGLATATFGKAFIRTMCGWGCGLAVGADTKEQHERDCPKRIIPCRLGCPIHDLWKKDMADHERDDCPKRLLHCPNDCIAVVVAEDLERHLDEHCVKRRVFCAFGCGKGLREEQRQEHQDNQCPCRPVPCDHECGELVPFNKKLAHWKNDCKKRDVRCRIGCGMTMREELREEHETTLCLHRVIQCKWECDEEVRANQQARHEAETCPMREVACPLRCGVPVKSSLMDEHKANECGKRFVSCPLHCSLKVRAEKLEQHTAHECTKRREECTLGCGQVIVGAAFEIHLTRECPKRISKCGYGCGEHIMAELMADHHENDCTRRLVPCSRLGCFAKVPFDELVWHEAQQCRFRMVLCKFGCKSTIHAKLYEKHLKEECSMRFVDCAFCGTQLRAHDRDYHETKQCLQRPPPPTHRTEFSGSFGFDTARSSLYGDDTFLTTGPPEMGRRAKSSHQLRRGFEETKEAKAERLARETQARSLKRANTARAALRQASQLAARAGAQLGIDMTSTAMMQKLIGENKQKALKDVADLEAKKKADELASLAKMSAKGRKRAERRKREQQRRQAALAAAGVGGSPSASPASSKKDSPTSSPAGSALASPRSSPGASPRGTRPRTGSAGRAKLLADVPLGPVQPRPASRERASTAPLRPSKLRMSTTAGDDDGGAPAAAGAGAPGRAASGKRPVLKPLPLQQVKRK